MKTIYTFYVKDSRGRIHCGHVDRKVALRRDGVNARVTGGMGYVFHRGYPYTVAYAFRAAGDVAWSDTEDAAVAFKWAFK